MKEWVQIPFTHKSRWKEFAALSANSVGIIKKKTIGK